MRLQLAFVLAVAAMAASARVPSPRGPQREPVIKMTYKDQDHLDVMGHVRASKSAKSGNAVEGMDYWNQQMQAELQDQLAKSPIVKQAKNIIFFLGDGTSISTLTAARLLKGHSTGNGEHEVMAYERFPYSSLIKTYSADKIVTDSAASATAYLTGAKGNQATIGVDANVLLSDCDAMNNPSYHTSSVLKNFQDAGKSTGIVTVTRVTHASPAGNYAHTAERHWENDDDINDINGDPEKCDDIAEQLVYGPTGSKIKVILGGGRKKLTPKGVDDPEGGDGGRRDDGKNLIQSWIDQKQVLGNASYVWHRNDLLQVDTANTDYLMGLFDWSHMAFAIDQDTSNPSLEEMTRAAIEVLQRDDNGFFLFVEGGNIDKAHHLNEHRSALEEALEFEKAIALADSMTNPEETLIIVTADHSQPLVINGYPERGTDVLGLGDFSDVDGLPFTTLMYTNGPGYRGEPQGERPDPSTENYNDPHYMGAATVPMIESHHAGEEVILYARGPHAHLFTGIHENAYIPHALRYAACVGDGLQFCPTEA
ncbi:alkaline phosphatase-like [Penaeus chinensis]|uniref:alkaline phosphatase-like n=1 Tax=Penaeus chinensis TaxID=139456 RepID=UPI001FB7C2EF|nr:alkaline phosphatase-like [Penaeus chinensis]XP_047483490.1 alkaline phosphatase-like [Penaeus chinensis]